MSTCISRHGEYSEHEVAADEYVCQRCFVLDEDRMHTDLAALRRQADELTAERDEIRNQQPFRVAEAHRLRAEAAERTVDAQAEVIEAVRTRVEHMLTAPAQYQSNNLMLPGDRETWKVRRVTETYIRGTLDLLAAAPTPPTEAKVCGGWLAGGETCTKPPGHAERCYEPTPPAPAGPPVATGDEGGIGLLADNELVVAAYEHARAHANPDSSDGWLAEADRRFIAAVMAVVRREADSATGDEGEEVDGDA